MPIKYYPLTRIIPNLYTGGGEFTTPQGEQYVGRYYRTFDGKAFTGINPVIGTNFELNYQPLDITLSPGIGYQTTSTTAYADIQFKQQAPGAYPSLLTGLTPYFPLPLEEDYARGYFNRYFAKNPSGPGYVIEISETDWTQIQNGLTEPTLFEYESIKLLWQLMGPLHDTRISQYQIKGGVYDTNKRVTEAKAVGFVGLLAFIGGNYTKFARVTPDVAITRSM